MASQLQQLNGKWQALIKASSSTIAVVKGAYEKRDNRSKSSDPDFTPAGAEYASPIFGNTVPALWVALQQPPTMRGLG